MFRQITRVRNLFLVFAPSLALLALPACEAGKDSGNGGGDKTVQPSAAALAVLAKADAADGTTDKVVSKCLPCNLGMDGDSTQMVKFGEYELHLCSPEHKEQFEKAPEDMVLAAKLPEATPPK